MSLLFFDGEYIEIPEYILRIVKRAQTILSIETEDQGNLSAVTTDAGCNELEPTVITADGSAVTVSEYILGIIRTAQKIVQDTGECEDIKDYDRFIENTFDAMLNEAGADANEEPAVVIQAVVDQLIDEVCSSPKLKMPEMETSDISINIVPETMDVHSEEQSQTSIKSDSQNIVPYTDTDNAITKVEEILSNGEPFKSGKASVEERSDESKAKADECCQKLDVGKDDNQNLQKETTDQQNISDNELEKIAGKFVENICNEAKNILCSELENKTNIVTDLNKDDIHIRETVRVKAKSEIESADKKLLVNTEKITPNGQFDKTSPNESVENTGQNHTTKVHPSEGVVVNSEDITPTDNLPTKGSEDITPTDSLPTDGSEDITPTDSLPTEGKHGKEQKYNVSKDKIKSKRRSRGIRNSFRRMFSCFSTKSSQLE